MSFEEEHETTEFVTKRFKNGDEYIGGWRNKKQHGEGRYTWKDASWYEGQWKDGLKHGIGRHKWASGSSYQGEWRNGCMHGVGTFESVSEARYQGGWSQNLKHGLGKIIVSNGDMYEGIWKAGKPEGPGRYVWSDGNEYDGEWRSGRMHGQGTFAWTSGERYVGEWKEGQQHGLGYFTRPDGSHYDGQWHMGRKHGVGLYRPPMLDKDLKLTADLKRFTTANLSTHEMLQGQPSLSGASSGPTASSCSSGELYVEDSSATQVPYGAQAGSLSTDRSMSSLNQKDGSEASGKRVEYVRYYDNGFKLRERAIPLEDVRSVMQHLRANIDRKIVGASHTASSDSKSQKRMGKTIQKGHSSYNLMLDLQLGVRYSVGKITHEPAPKELQPADFELKVKQFFPSEGSEMTPVHPSEDFWYKDYCPMVFRKLRELFDIDAGEYMLSLCSDASLRLLNTPGKSGAVFFLSHDDKFFVKTLKKGETRLLFNMLPAYYEHVSSHPHTLLTKFYGLHRITLDGGRKFDLVVMGNLFNTSVQLDRKYDLKGSKLGRTAGTKDMDDPMTIYKDLDLDSTFRLEDGWNDRLIYQITADCALLESCSIMDYSLLLGIHYQRRHNSTDPSVRVQNFNEYSEESAFHKELPRIEERVAKMKLPDQARDDLMTLVKLRMRGGNRAKNRNPSLSQASADELALQLGQSRVQLGINMPAKSLPNNEVMGGIPEDAVLYFGIIDILQDFNPSKRIEHRLKSLVHDSYSISVTHPKTYSERFQKAMRNIFV